MDLGIVLGELNFVNFLHVRFEKVSAPGATVWEDWIPVPFTEYNLVAQLPDADNYYMLFYEAPDNTSLGTFKAKAYISALSAAYEFEIRFYKGGDLPSGATLDITKTELTDTYLIGKDIFFIDKEGYRIMNPLTEYTSTPVDGKILLLNGFILENDETMVVVIKNKTTTPGSASGSGLYKGYVTITEATRTLLNTEKNKRCRLLGTVSTQVINLPLLSTISDDDGYYLDNSVGGVCKQVKILTVGGDQIRFNGFQVTSDLFTEFWVSKGEFLNIKKFDGSYWEIVSDYKGVNVGERFSGMWLSHPNTLPEDSRLIDGEEYPRLYWWVRNVLPSTHKIIDDNVENTGYNSRVVNPTRFSQFVLHSTGKKFRMPDTQGLSERSLKSFTSYGTDVKRVYDYPGGFQEEEVGPHTHNVRTGSIQGISDDANDRNVMVPNNPGDLKTTEANVGLEQIVRNFGIINLCRI